MVNPGRRLQFLAGRVALRALLRARFGGQSDGWSISCVADQPPQVDATGSGVALAISISHSGGQVAVGITTGSRIGIDLEAHRPRRDLLGLAGFVATPREWQQLKAQQDDAVALQRSFHRLWTLKEAAAKCGGAGLDFALARMLDLQPLDDSSQGAAQAWTWEDQIAGWTLAMYGDGALADSLIALPGRGSLIEKRWQATHLAQPPQRPSRVVQAP